MLGLVIDQDGELSDGRRTVQLMPRESASAIAAAVVVSVAAAGTLNATLLTVTEIHRRAALIERGVAVMDITLLGGGGGGKFISCPVRCS